MKIETKFNPGDKVWVIHEGKALSFIIYIIKFEFTKNGQIIENYLNIGPENEAKFKIFEDRFCFTTREELINSL
jgi:hypothetical protein